MDYSPILSKPFIGSHPQAVDDTERLRQESAATAVLNCRRTKISAQLISIGNRLPSRSDEADLVVPQTASTYSRHALSDGLPMT